MRETKSTQDIICRRVRSIAVRLALQVVPAVYIKISFLCKNRFGVATIKRRKIMSLKSKLISLVTMICLVAGIMLVGIFAAQQQTLTMTGNVQFNINDRSLYVKQVRIKQDNSSAEPQVVSDFMPGYINGEFNMNIGEYDNSLGSFALYFDIINATDDEWEIKNVTLSEQLQSEQVSVTYSGIIEKNDIVEKDEDGYKIFDPETTDIDGSLILVVTAPNSDSINLSGITITLNMYIPPVLEGFSFENGVLTAYTGTSSHVEIPDSYSIVNTDLPTTFVYDSIPSITMGEEMNLNQLAILSSFHYRDANGNEGDVENYFTDLPTEIAFPITIETDYKFVCNEELGDNVLNYLLAFVSVYQSLSDSGGIDPVIYVDTATTEPYLCNNYDELNAYMGSIITDTSAFPITFELVSKTGNVVIEGEDYKVTAIGEGVFQDSDTITSISLPSSLTSIGNSAFSHCGGLTEVDLSNCTSLASIGEWAFASCHGLMIDLSNCTSLTNIGSGAFTDCQSLTEVDLSNCTSLISIGDGAFVNCSHLASITLPYPTEWYRTTSSSAISGDPMDMSDPEQNATWLTGDHDHYFKRNA